MTLDMTFEAREKIIRRDEFAAGKTEGIAEGITEGETKKADDIFLNMLSHGFDVAQAIEITGITRERAEQLISCRKNKK